MKNFLPISREGRWLRFFVLLLLGVSLLLTSASPAAAQKDKKKKKNAPGADTSGTIIPLPDEQAIDYMISEMLGAWQVGDVEKMHKDYADDVSVVSGTWAPPVIGWNNYLVLYKQQRARMQQVRMDRTNTYIKVNGTIGWACYQWDFAAVVDGQPMEVRGQTTLVMEKRSNRWVIVHNHTAVIQVAQPSAPGSTPPTAPPQPGKPAPR